MIPCILVHSPYDSATIFASDCASEISALLRSRSLQLIELFGADANKKKLQEYLQSNLSQVHCFLDYGHGNETALFGHNDEVLVEMRSAVLLRKKICCVFACSAARQLGKEIIRKGGISFLGFDGDFMFFPPHKEIFKKCINSSVKAMVIDKKPIGMAFEYMKKTFNEMIDYLTSIIGTSNWVAIVCLRIDRDRLELVGDRLASLW